jgi:hypothetical protein
MNHINFFPNKVKINNTILEVALNNHSINQNKTDSSASLKRLYHILRIFN